MRPVVASTCARCEVIFQRHRVLHVEIDDEYYEDMWEETSVDYLECVIGKWFSGRGMSISCMNGDRLKQG